jgi:predicted transposase/invertase (TIGR01784 family)
MNAAQASPAIEKAWGVIKVLSGDERARALAEAREKARMDLDSWLDDARYEGRQEGQQEEKREIARTALRKNMPHTVIADLTGLSLEELKQLAAALTD